MVILELKKEAFLTTFVLTDDYWELPIICNKFVTDELGSIEVKKIKLVLSDKPFEGCKKAQCLYTPGDRLENLCIDGEEIMIFSSLSKIILDVLKVKFNIFRPIRSVRNIAQFRKNKKYIYWRIHDNTQNSL